MNSPLVTLFGREFVQNRQEKSLKTNVFRQIVYEIPGIEATRPQCAVIMRKDPI